MYSTEQPPSRSSETPHRASRPATRASHQRTAASSSAAKTRSSRRWADSENVLDLTELRRSRALEVEREVQRELKAEAPPRRTAERAAVSKVTTKAQAAAKPRLAPCHWGLIVVTLIIALISIPVVYSASQANALNYFGNVNFFLTRQVGFVGIGVLFMLGASRLSKIGLRYMIWILYGVSLLGLIAIEITPLGQTLGGTTRWLRLGPVQIQVSEFAKIALIGVLADFWSRAAISDRGKWWPWIAAFGLSLPFVLLVAKQPHLSGALLLASIPMIIGYFAGAPAKKFYAMLGTVGALVAMLLALNALHLMPKLPIHKYQQERLEHVFSKKSANADRGANYQSLQGLRAIERGGWFGVGPGASLYKQGHLPAPHTDFILAIIGEEFGLAGMMGLLACYGFIVFFCFQIGFVSGNAFESMVCAGVGTLFALQMVANMCVVLDVPYVPVTGILLPLISYGGSGFISFTVALGFVLAISRRSGQETEQVA